MTHWVISQRLLSESNLAASSGRLVFDNYIINFQSQQRFQTFLQNNFLPGSSASWLVEATLWLIIPESLYWEPMGTVFDPTLRGEKNKRNSVRFAEHRAEQIFHLSVFYQWVAASEKLQDNCGSLFCSRRPIRTADFGPSERTLHSPVRHLQGGRNLQIKVSSVSHQ